MNTDKSLIFFESKTVPGSEAVVELNGSSYGRSFVFCTIPAGVTALTLTYKTSKDGTTYAEEEHAATALDIARGLMFFPTNLNEVVKAKCVPAITGTAEKELVCGITDAVDNAEAFYAA